MSLIADAEHKRRLHFFGESQLQRLAENSFA